LQLLFLSFLATRHDCPSAEFWRQSVHASVSVVQAAVKGLALAQAAAVAGAATGVAVPMSTRSLEQANHALWGAVGAVLQTAVSTPAWYPDTLGDTDIEVPCRLGGFSCFFFVFLLFCCFLLFLRSSFLVKLTVFKFVTLGGPSGGSRDGAFDPRYSADQRGDSGGAAAAACICIGNGGSGGGPQ
jgi:hypothetical protein